MVRDGLGLGNSSLIQLTEALTLGYPLARGECLWEIGKKELSIAGGGERCPWSLLYSRPPTGQLSHSEHSRVGWQPHTGDTPCARSLCGLFFNLNSKEFQETSTFIFSNLHMRKLSHREVKEVSQGPTAKR